MMKFFCTGVHHLCTIDALVPWLQGRMCLQIHTSHLHLEKLMFDLMRDICFTHLIVSWTNECVTIVSVIPRYNVFDDTLDYGT